jgi:hypothetical protein
VAKTAKAQWKTIGYIVLCEGKVLKSRKKYHGALMPVRKGEAPDLFHDKRSAEFLIGVTEKILGENTFHVIPIKHPLIGFRVVENDRTLSEREALRRVRRKRSRLRDAG